MNGKGRRAGQAALVAIALLGIACQEHEPEGPAPVDGSSWEGDWSEVGQVTGLPDRPIEGAGPAFWRTWGDSRAEVAAYEASVERYGALRDAELVLVTVVEPMDRRTWVKDDRLPEGERLYVVKLIQSLKFRTGFYPYSVETISYSPVDRYFAERFDPVKITLTSQEWCGHVFHGLWPGRGRALETVISYFASEGHRTGFVELPAEVLYEDALPVQLRELDGPFAGGGDWEGQLVPSLWSARKKHAPLAPVAATISRTEDAGRTTFLLRRGEVERTFVIEGGRLVAMTASGGESARLLGLERIAYWQLNAADGRGAEARRRLGLSSDTEGD